MTGHQYWLAASLPHVRVFATNLEAMIAEQLRQVIERRELTQVDAAALLGTSVKHLNQVLGMRATPRLQTLQRWSEKLGIHWSVTATDDTDGKH